MAETLNRQGLYKGGSNGEHNISPVWHFVVRCSISSFKAIMPTFILLDTTKVQGATRRAQRVLNSIYRILHDLLPSEWADYFTGKTIHFSYYYALIGGRNRVTTRDVRRALKRTKRGKGCSVIGCSCQF